MADAPSRPSCDIPPPVSAIPLLSAVSLDLSAPVLTSQHFLPYKPPVPPFSPCLPALPSTWFQFLSSAPPSSVIFPLAFLDLWFLLYCLSSCSLLSMALSSWNMCFQEAAVLHVCLAGPRQGCWPLDEVVSPVSEEQDSVTHEILRSGFFKCIWTWWDLCLPVMDSVIS